ncbi:MAG TPA: ROK family protein [Euzebyales bacterium]|nr:ROK family protein [Euzebyales bacterium]
MAALGATHIAVGLTDLTGTLLHKHVEPHDIATGPEPTLERVRELFGRGLEADGLPAEAQVYGIGIGLPGPIEFASGKPVSPPIMPGWDRYPVRARLADRYGMPVWVDNDVNLMALGEVRAGVAKDEHSVIFVKLGTGIGAGLVTSGRLHCGAQGCAGDIGHVAVAHGSGFICRCGNEGCLEALAAGLRWPAMASRSPRPDAVPSWRRSWSPERHWRRSTSVARRRALTWPSCSPAA